MHLQQDLFKPTYVELFSLIPLLWYEEELQVPNSNHKLGHVKSLA